MLPDVDQRLLGHVVDRPAPACRAEALVVERCWSSSTGMPSSSGQTRLTTSGLLGSSLRLTVTTSEMRLSTRTRPRCGRGCAAGRLLVDEAHAGWRRRGLDGRSPAPAGTRGARAGRRTARARRRRARRAAGATNQGSRAHAIRRRPGACGLRNAPRTSGTTTTAQSRVRSTPTTPRSPRGSRPVTQLALAEQRADEREQHLAGRAGHGR